jgi:hypothetical protein
MRIAAADDLAVIRNAGGYRPWVASIIKARWGHDVVWDVDEDAVPVTAFVNNGDWVARCDVLEGAASPCGGSMVVTHRDPVFVCDECVNVEQGHKPRLVEFPDDASRGIIEELLTARPHPRLRQYNPRNGDTVTMLKEENTTQPWRVKHGLD